MASKSSKNYIVKPEHRLEFGQFIDRAFWAVLTGAVLYSASQLKSLGSNVNELNEKMAVVVSRLSDYDRRVDELNRRLDRQGDVIKDLLSEKDNKKYR